MTRINFSKLDNPAWFSLNESHEKFAEGAEAIKIYQAKICPFGGINGAYEAINFQNAAFLERERFFIIGKKPQLPPELVIEKELICLQMLCQTPIHWVPQETILQLKDQHMDELHRLVNLVQPGYFKEGTSKMGNYYGIFKAEKLVAVTGERMKMHQFTEISAVITHPEHTRKGYAKQLVAHVVNQNIAVQNIPYLHVVESNLGAIGLYKKLGFETRRKISFWLVKNTQKI